MNYSLDYYLQQILCRKESVIVPGFGIFSNEILASRVVETNGSLKIYPSQRKVGFERNLLGNDSSLAIELSKTMNTGDMNHLDDVSLFIENDVESWLKELQNNHYLELNYLGRFFITETGDWRFEINPDIEFEANNFGLYPIDIKAIKRISNTENVNDEIETESIIHSEKVKFIDKKYVKIILGVSILVILSVGGYYLNRLNRFSKERSSKRALIQKDTLQANSVKTPSLDSTKTERDSILPVEKPVLETTKSTVPKSDEKKHGYYIVVGSFSDINNAEKLSEKIKQDGGLGVIIERSVSGKILHCVTNQYFETRAAAEEEKIKYENNTNQSVGIIKW
jgi:hypothetical protein